MAPAFDCEAACFRYSSHPRHVAGPGRSAGPQHVGIQSVHGLAATRFSPGRRQLRHGSTDPQVHQLRAVDLECRARLQQRPCARVSTASLAPGPDRSASTIASNEGNQGCALLDCGCDGRRELEGAAISSAPLLRAAADTDLHCRLCSRGASVCLTTTRIRRRAITSSSSAPPNARRP